MLQVMNKKKITETVKSIAKKPNLSLCFKTYDLE